MEEEPVQDEWNMTMTDKAAPHTNTLKTIPVADLGMTAEEIEEEEMLDEEEEELMDQTSDEIETEEEEEIEEDEPATEVELTVPVAEKEKKAPQQAEHELAIEVKQDEEPVVIAQNAHISIEDNEPYAPELDLRDYKFPTLDLLQDRTETITLDKDELEKNKNQIIQTLRSFGIEIQRISATVGPTVTLYEIVPAEGVRISKIRNLEDDIALNLAALGIRIIAPIPGRGTIGIEVPNTNKQIVSMRTLLASEKFAKSNMSLPIALGKKIDNENYIVDLATMPHLLMAGATGQGKSVGINAILVSLLYKKHPSQLKFVMIDPKKVELSIYRTIEKHFLAKLPNEEEAIITDTKKVIYTLNALCIEMDNRYELLKEAGARNIKEYNEKFIARKLNPQRGHKYLPFIVLVIDEFADLIMTAGKEVEMPIARLAQLARAIGIHLIIATQRPSVNVITGTIKANFPGRIAFKVSAKVDSRTILDAGGAEQLIGRGDMLVSYGSELLRVQCAFVDTPEVEKIVDFIGTQRGYPSAFELPEYEGEDGENDKIVDLTNRDKLFEDCARTVVQTQSGSTSMLQRRYNLGYNRAGRIMDQLESAGIVGPSMGSKPREVYFKTEMELEEFLSTLND
jgi:S-DNA-T family DNA segregation ATPase FtsK/SpoIIIE